jgi:hypothetical protein
MEAVGASETSVNISGILHGLKTHKINIRTFNTMEISNQKSAYDDMEIVYCN